MLKDSRFRTHYSFMFLAYNILNTLSVCKAARFKIMSSSDLKTMSKITKKEIKEMLNSMELPKECQVHSSKVEVLMKNVSAVGRNVPGSDYSKKKKRIEIRSLTLLREKQRKRKRKKKKGKKSTQKKIEICYLL